MCYNIQKKVHGLHLPMLYAPVHMYMHKQGCNFETETCMTSIMTRQEFTMLFLCQSSFVLCFAAVTHVRARVRTCMHACVQACTQTCPPHRHTYTLTARPCPPSCLCPLSDTLRQCLMAVTQRRTHSKSGLMHVCSPRYQRVPPGISEYPRIVCSISEYPKGIFLGTIF